MDQDTAMGVAAELRAFLKSGWTSTYDAIRFEVKSPTSVKASKESEDELVDEVWRISRLIAYRNFVSIRQENDGGFTVVSTMKSGNGFEIKFLPVSP
jgi:hypothetical protein